MKFCENCGNILRVKAEGDEKFLYCRSCNRRYPLEEMKLAVQHESKEQKIIVVDENAPSEFPVTQIMCPKCGEVREAFWTMQQTRGGDEPPTRFYQCKTCNWRWREYS